MTRKEFDKTGFYNGIKAKYKGETRLIKEVNFEEDLIGLQTDDMLETEWVRCENCEIVKSEKLI